MNYFGLVDTLKAYCTAHNYIFIYGTEDYANAQADKSVSKGQLILFCDPVICNPTYAGGTITSMRYTCSLALGRKFETSTTASLDETFIQKHDRRISELSTILSVMIGTLACDNELDIVSASFKLMINHFDLNADFIAASLTFIQGIE